MIRLGATGAKPPLAHKFATAEADTTLVYQRGRILVRDLAAQFRLVRPSQEINFDQFPAWLQRCARRCARAFAASVRISLAAN